MLWYASRRLPNGQTLIKSAQELIQAQMNYSMREARDHPVDRVRVHIFHRSFIWCCLFDEIFAYRGLARFIIYLLNFS